MKQKGLIFILAVLGCFILQAGLANYLSAQEETYEIGNEEIFGKLKRPAVTFPHETHMDAVENGCGACHHVYDKEKGTLVAADGEETTCVECHVAKKEGHKPGLREAYHGSCNICHRQLAKKGKTTAPTTCGQCHKKK